MSSTKKNLTTCSDKPTAALTLMPLDTWRNLIACFVLGWMNNMSFVVVLGGAQSLANDFGKGSLIGVIAWADVGLGLAIRGINVAYMERWSIHYRMRIVEVLFTVGLVGVALSEYVNFWMSVVSISLIGAGGALGESLILSHLRHYPVACTGAWGSGTGMAGVGGALFYLALSSLHLNNTVIFLMMLPSVIIHTTAFFWILTPATPIKDTTVDPETPLIRVGSKGRRVEKNGVAYSALTVNDDGVGMEEASINNSTGNNEVTVVSGLEEGTGPSECLENIRLITQLDTNNDMGGGGGSERRGGWGGGGGMSMDARGGSMETEKEVDDDEEEEDMKLWRVNRLVFRYSSQLALVYFFEYVVSVGAAAAATDAWKADTRHYFREHAYTMLSFSYQFGVLISRSSLSLLRIRRIELLTLCQALNFVIWLGIVKYGWVDSVWVLDGMMVWVGLLGGAMYVNSFASLMEDARVLPRDAETGINLVNIWINVGIVMSSVFDIILDAIIVG